MRILVVVHGFPPAVQGGSEIYAHALAMAMRRQFHDEILVLTRVNDPSRPEYDVTVERRGGLEVVRINNTFRLTRSVEDSYRHKAIADRLEPFIASFKPDVAHIHHLTCLSTDLVGQLGRRGVPAVMTLHDYWLMCHRGQLLDVNLQLCDGPDKNGCGACLGPAAQVHPVIAAAAPAWRAVERHAPRPLAAPLRRIAALTASAAGARAVECSAAASRLAHMKDVCSRIDHFVAPSHYVRDRFVQFGIDADRISVSRMGFPDSPTPRQRPRNAAAPLRVGFVGSMMVSKAPHVLLEAIRRLPGAATVDMFGAFVPYHGDDRYQQTLKPLLQHPAVHVHGPLSHDEIATALAPLDVLVVPSIWPENSPLTISEAFLAGVPVVASDIGGIPELVTHERSGLLFKAGDPAGLTACLRRLLDDPDLLPRLRNGLPAVRRIEDDASATRELYCRTIASASADRNLAANDRIAAVVLHYRQPDDTRLAVQSLLASDTAIDPILVVDNDGAATLALGSDPRVTVLHQPVNRGYSGGMNAGIREALARGATHVLLANSDTIVPPDCVSRLRRALVEPAAGIAGPLVASRGVPDTIESRGIHYDARTGRMRMLDARRAFAQAEAAWAPSTAVDAVSGCLMLVDGRVFRAIGELDEAFFFGFEDLDFCLRARQAGWATLVVRDAVAYHEGSKSIGADAPIRLRYAARNHLWLAHHRGAAADRLAGALRTSTVIALNLAHAVRSPGSSLLARLTAVIGGTRDYFAGRVGPIA